MAAAGAASGDARAKRVLVVDDDDAVRTMLLVVLEAADYDVRGVADGGEALNVAAEWRPDVILLDLLMPRMSGREFLAHRATMPDLPDIPVIVVTAATSRDVPSAGQLGVRAVVQQPHDVGLLRTLIQHSCLEGQVRHFLREQGEGHPVPILGGFVVRAQPDGSVKIYWDLPGPPALGSLRRLGHLRRYERLLRSWGMTTELHLEEPEPYVACWVIGG